MSFKDKYQALLEKIYALQNRGIKLDLDNVTAVLDVLGNPQDKLKVIHIAGTNGKGSCAAMLDGILRQAGYKTGIFTSPHLEVFNERIKVDGQNIADEMAYDLAQKVLEAADDEDLDLTFFEIVTVMAFCVFAETGVDYAILETGMGGRLDATNVVLPEVALITNVTLEHTRWLGDTVAKIAFEKAGIIKRGIPVVTAADGDALDVIKHKALDLNAPLSILDGDFAVDDKTLGGYYGVFDYRSRPLALLPESETQELGLKYRDLRLGLAGGHQLKNAACVLRALEYLAAKGAVVSEAAVREGLALARWQGRLEIVFKNPLVLLDGAHNPAGMRTLVDFINAHGLGGRVVLIAGVLEDKNYEAMLKMILPLCKRVIFTKPQSERALDLGRLQQWARIFKIDAMAERSIEKAITLGLMFTEDHDVLCVTGSLYLVGAARETLIKQVELIA